MKTYRVVIHYEGAYATEVEAENEDEAKEIAENRFAELSSEDIDENLADVFVDDCWEVKKGEEDI